jgi:hypothetical protein
VSGASSASPSSAATRCAPAFTANVSSVQVSPDNHSSTGAGPSPGGRNSENRIGVPVDAASCS